MADSIELHMSVTSIKRVDPYVNKVLATATHVALYSFNTVRNEWEKTETEGALFVYNRNGEPYHSIMIMNRLNTDNLIEPVVKDFDYQMQVPFLLYRNSKSKIFGIWFFNREECIRITFLIESLMEGLKDKDEDKAERRERNVDIFTMLSRAQEDFNKTPSKGGESPVCSSTPRVPDLTSQSVMDFFAKASTKSSQKAPVPGNTGENVLQRLMSNPAHSVEHIEKQQRSVTPQDQVIKTRPDHRRSVPIADTNNVSPLAFFLQGAPNQSQAEKEGSAGEALSTSPFAQFLENSKKPHLMTPMMFSGPGSSLVGNSEEQPVDPLTEKQLAQALIYLLRNNSDFIRQVHDAYVQSINEKVSHGGKKSLF